MTASTNRRLAAHAAESRWRAWKSCGDWQARDRLILAYAPMVKYLALKKARELPTHCELDDLVSCGLVAVVEAVDRFDPVKGATFEQYAWMRVTGAIVDELRRLDRVSRSSRVLARSIERAQDAWFARIGAQPSESELAGELRVGVQELREIQSALDRAHVVSLNAPTSRSQEERTEIGETIAAPIGRHDPERALLARERLECLRAAVTTLSARERMVFGLVHVNDIQGAEVSRLLGVTESRVSQILSSARHKLRHALASYEGTIDARCASVTAELSYPSGRARADATRSGGSCR
jgi:RNA polymerase sigma factor for flagellar operon FliA